MQNLLTMNLMIFWFNSLNPPSKNNVSSWWRRLKLKNQWAKRKLITNKVDAENPTIITKLEDLRIDLASDKELLNDIVLTGVMRGETVKLINNYKQAMLPLFTVTMRKAD